MDTAPGNADKEHRIEFTPFHLLKDDLPVQGRRRFKKGTGAYPAPAIESLQFFHFAGFPRFFAALELFILLLRSAIFASLCLR